MTSTPAPAPVTSPQRRPVLGITVGDPAGIGPEVTLKAVQDPRVAGARLLAIGSLQALERARAWVPGAPALRPVDSPGQARYEHGVLDVVVVPSDAAVPVGELSRRGRPDRLRGRRAGGRAGGRPARSTASSPRR